MNSRELVLNTLEFKHSGRVPRQLWSLPIAKMNFPEEMKALCEKYPPDIDGVPGFCAETAKQTGDPHRIGSYTDKWGCVFENINAGVHGEVKNPIVKDWSDTSKVIFPREDLTINIEKINQYCSESDKFLLSGCVPRPFERLQFIRGTEELFIDIALEDKGMLDFAQKLHEYFLEELNLWAKTDVDGMFFMDDWGSQKSLLIAPKQWRKIFKPFYKDYADLAHANGKKIFMHSDGYILDIYPDLIEIGIDAVNSQIFCMGIDNLAQFKGQITFWGEIDRQHLLIEGSLDDIADAVKEVYAKLYDNGGVFAQCEFGPGATPDRIDTVFKTWNEISQ